MVTSKTKKQGQQTLILRSQPKIASWASIVGPKEGEGPWGDCFDWALEDYLFGETTWEKAESKMLQETIKLAISKSVYQDSEIELLLAGDLLNQTIASGFAARQLNIPFLGLFGACSTMAEALVIGAMLIDGGHFQKVAVGASSHHFSAERQFRLPIEQGVQKSPSSQWTATAAGAIVLDNIAPGPRITEVTIGKVIDRGIVDVSDMGSAMAPAAADTIKTHFQDLNRVTDYYDLIVTGDLGKVGMSIAEQLFIKEGLVPFPKYSDCGVLLYDQNQDVNAGASGCGCAASMLCGPLLSKIKKGEINKLLFVATGALMSPTSSWQGESIPGVAHAVAIEF